MFGFFRNYSLFQKIPYFFGLGVGLVGMQLFFYSYFSLEWSLELIFAPWLVFSIAAIIKNNYTIPKFAVKFSILEKFLAILTAMLVIHVCLEAVLRPLSAWDGWAIWVLKARMFFVDGYVNTEVYHLLHENYPYIINLSIVFLLKFLTVFDDTAILLYFFAFYLFTGIAFYTSLRMHAARSIAIFFTFLLFATQNFLRHGGRFEAGYADLVLGFYIFCSLMLLFQFFARRRREDLIIFGIFLTITSLIKEEGLIFSLTLFLIASAYSLQKRKYIHLAILLLTLLPTFFWQIFKFQNGLAYSLYSNSALHTSRLLNVLIEVFYEMINIKNWNLLWLTFLIASYLGWKFKIYRGRLILIVIGAQLVSYIFVFLLSPHSPAEHVSSTMNRLFLHIFPLAVFYTALVFSIMIRKNLINESSE